MASRIIDRVRNAQQNSGGESSADPQQYATIKHELHAEIVDAIDFEQIQRMPKEQLTARLQGQLRDMIEARSVMLNRSERERMVSEIVDEILGLGPLEPLLADPDITDILINGPKTIYVERGGKLQAVETTFDDDAHLMHIIDRVVSSVGRRIDETHPMVDARLADGSRFNAIIPPLALDGPMVSIRRFGHVPVSAEDLVRTASLPKPMLDLLHACVRAKLNVLISGGTGSGKTTLLNVLSRYIPVGERVVTIEDAAELRLQRPHVVRLETRPANLEGSGQVTACDLVRNALRMRPDRIIVGEVRGVEAADMLQAMNTGHEGSLGTVHANSARDALSRVETMVGMGMGNLTDQRIRELIARALDLVVHLDRLPDGSRRIMAITEVLGIEGTVITTQDIFVFDQGGIDEDGKVRGAFKATGVRPAFSEKLQQHGITLPGDLFRYRRDI